MFILMPEWYCFDYCRFVENFEMRKYESFNFIFRIVAAMQVSLKFHVNLNFDFSISAKVLLGF